MPDRCPKDGGFIGEAGCTHPNHEHSELVKRLLATGDSPAEISVEDAEAALKEGFYADGPNGRVGFGPKLLEHLDTHAPKDAEGRKKRLAFAIATVGKPDKVETKHQGLDGRTAYVRSFDGIGVLVVTDKSGKGVEDVFTFVPKRGLKKRGLPPEQTPEGTH